MLVRIANKQSDLGSHCFSRHFGRQLVLEILENLPYFLSCYPKINVFQCSPKLSLNFYVPCS